jgi:hypothetical protein
MNTVTVHQPREAAVPCVPCGTRGSRFGSAPKTMTWNRNGLCDSHQPMTRVDVTIWTATVAQPEWQSYFPVAS